jgi:hypothetical protein
LEDESVLRNVVALILTGILASTACAGDIFVRPETCTLVATIQTDSCEVENDYTCPTENGPINRTESFDEAGLTSVSIEDLLIGQVTTSFVWDDGSFRLQYSGDKDIDIVRNGTGASSAVGEVKMFGLWRPISGSDTSTYSGETMELAGVSFHRIESMATLRLPYPVPEIIGREVRAYNEDLDLSVSIEREYLEGASSALNSKLAQLSLPGQPGFGDEFPRYGCDTLSEISPRTGSGELG